MISDFIKTTDISSIDTKNFLNNVYDYYNTDEHKDIIKLFKSTFANSQQLEELIDYCGLSQSRSDFYFFIIKCLPEAFNKSFTKNSKVKMDEEGFTTTNLL